jgi:peptide/nickel transport system permease protein
VIGRVVRSPSLRIAGKRLLQAVPVIWASTFITFCLLNLLPGSAASALLGEGATPEDVQRLEQALNLDQPFVVRYFSWLGNALTGDLGTSFATHQPVLDVVVSRTSVSVGLVVSAFVVALLFAIPVAALTAKRPGGIADRISVVISMGGLSLPNFVFALVLIFVFAVTLGAVPALGYVPFSTDPAGWLQTVTLPVITLAFSLFCVFSRLLRADIVDQLLTEDYITTARAKGVHPWAVLIRHALRNSLFGLLTVVGLQLGGLIGSTAIIEVVFGIPGLGQELLRAIANKDIPLVEGIVVAMALATILANLLADLLYAVLDPRVRHDART